MSESTTPSTPAATTTDSAPTEAPQTSAPAAGGSPPASPAGAGDSPPVPAPSEPAPEDRLNKGFVELTRKEKAFRAAQEAHKVEVAEAKAWKELQAKLKEDPSLLLSDVAERLGITLDQAAAAYAKKVVPPTAETRLEKLERESAEREKAAQAAQAKAEQDQVAAHVEAYRGDAQRFIDAAPDDFQALVYMAGVSNVDVGSIVVAASERHYKETGEILDPEDAAKKVEEHLAKGIEARVKGLLGFGKFKGLFGGATPAPSTTPAVKAPAPTSSKPSDDDDDEDAPPVTTITNRTAAAGKGVTKARYTPTSDDDAIARAVKAAMAASGKR